MNDLPGVEEVYDALVNNTGRKVESDVWYALGEKVVAAVGHRPVTTYKAAVTRCISLHSGRVAFLDNWEETLAD